MIFGVAVIKIICYLIVYLIKIYKKNSDICKVYYKERVSILEYFSFITVLIFESLINDSFSFSFR